MREPAILWKEELTKAFSRTLYTEKYLWYEGSIENYEREITEEADKFQFAIVESGQVIGFITFRVDWYCSCAFNFGLIKFLDIYFDNATQEYKDSTPIMSNAIREVIKMVQSFNLHRIDFRCVSGNPAERKYFKLMPLFRKDYHIRPVKFFNNIKDRQGNYHDTIMYEFIRRE